MTTRRLIAHAQMDPENVDTHGRWLPELTGVEAVVIAHRAVVIAYERSQFRGPSYELTRGEYRRETNLAMMQVHSVRVPPGMCVKICSNLSASGNAQEALMNCVTLTANGPQIDHVNNLDASAVSFVSVEATCEPTCKHGTCVGPNRCRCYTGFQGALCERRMCDRSKVSCAHGKCDDHGWCVCDSGWHGPSCTEATCFKPCLNGGRCVAPNVCECVDGFLGATCAVPVAVCGDGTCDKRTETCATCTADCGPCDEPFFSAKRRRLVLLYPEDREKLELAAGAAETAGGNPAPLGKDGWSREEAEYPGGGELMVLGVSFHPSEMGAVLALGAALVAMGAMAVLACVLQITAGVLTRSRTEIKREAGKAD
eukprot:Unigene11525_Nuclearia_a/m.35121 Unigene11525_Nuclearia_a/g.35121  ORF Unigene11525_Nuclearia_a/g.35121 Unigene11525_Nuclearia_a/m.35121 type:complete len:369 (+) Unigene11525_Nuclearia_a:623-1729(+)